ncbi:MAG: PAS domain-containing sensor histidine kinase [Pseudonocardiaceae bacterium]
MPRLLEPSAYHPSIGWSNRCNQDEKSGLSYLMLEEPGLTTHTEHDRILSLRSALAPFDECPVSFWLSEGCENDFRIVFWNSGAEMIYGYPRTEALGQSYLNLFVTDEQREQSRVDAQRVIDTGEHPRNCIAIDKNKSGGEIILLTNVFRFVYEGYPYQAEIAVNLTPSGFLEFLDDDYRKQRDDPKTHEDARQLYYFVRHARNLLERQLALWSLTFAHTIRSELARVGSSLELLKEANPDIARHDSYLDLSAATSILLRHANNFQAYQGLASMATTPEDLPGFVEGGLLAEMVSAQDYSARIHGLEINLNISGAYARSILRGSRGSYDGVLNNLLRNAIDHIDIVAAADRPVVDVKAWVEPDELKAAIVEIANPGRVKENVLRENFGAFYSDLTDQDQRLHLGLAISHRWLEEVGGHLTLVNQGNRRVVARVEWPLAGNQPNLS